MFPFVIELADITAHKRFYIREHIITVVKAVVCVFDVCQRLIVCIVICKVEAKKQINKTFNNEEQQKKKKRKKETKKNLKKYNFIFSNLKKKYLTQKRNMYK